MTMAATPETLKEFLRRECESPPSGAALAVVEAARRRHGATVKAVLFYGSCLRDGADEERIIDLYLLVGSCRMALINPVSALLCRRLPPNVYYVETDFQGRTVRAKYALMELDQFIRGVSGQWLQSYLWARFAQPTTIVMASDETVKDRLLEALRGAILKMLEESLPLAAEEFDTRTLWSRGFQESYRAELRAERPGRAEEIVDAFAERYRGVSALAFKEKHGATVAALGCDRYRQRQSDRDSSLCRRRWLLRRLIGKPLTVLRLCKAAFTFRGGAKYLAWKIERHSGVKVALAPWQERHPILASSVLFWKLYRKGAFR